MSATGLSASESEALRARHAAILAPERSCHGPEADGRAEAIDAARERLQGGSRPGPDQLVLDVRGQ